MKLEYERLKQERINTSKQQALLEEANFVHHQRGRILDNEHFAQQASLRREEMLGDAQQLKQQSERLDAQMEVLENHNKQLLDQMARLRQMLNAENSLNYGNAYPGEKNLPITSILKNASGSMGRNVPNKSIHFSNSNIILDTYPID